MKRHIKQIVAYITHIVLLSLLTLFIAACSTKDLDSLVTNSNYLKVTLESASTKADLNVGSADGENNTYPFEYITPEPLESQNNTVRDLCRDDAFEKETKVDITYSGAMSWTTGDQIAYCISNGVSSQYNIGTLNVSQGILAEVVPNGYSRANYAIYPSTAAGTNYSSPSVIYANSYSLDGIANTETYSFAPMISSNTIEPMTFYHVGGILRVTCALIPLATKTIRVTFNGMTCVTGTYTVSNPGTTSASTIVSSGNRNYVDFTKSSFGSNVTFNVPLPSGSYSSCTSITIATLDSGGNTLGSQTINWWVNEVRRGCGYRVSIIMGEVAITNSPQTLWKGNTYTYVGSVSGSGVIWSSSNTSVATVTQSGVVTAIGKGEADISLSVEEVGLSTSCKVYVNEVIGINGSGGTINLGSSSDSYISLTINDSSSPTIYGTISGLNPNAFVVTNNTPSIISFTSSPSASSNYSFKLGTVNSLTVGTGSITVTLPANTYGSHSAFSQTLTYTVQEPLYLDFSYSISPSCNIANLVAYEQDFTVTTTTNFTTSITIKATYKGSTWYCNSAQELAARFSALGDNTVRLNMQIQIDPAKASSGGWYETDSKNRVTYTYDWDTSSGGSGTNYSFTQSNALLSGLQFIRIRFGLLNINVPIVVTGIDRPSNYCYAPNEMDFWIYKKQ